MESLALSSLNPRKTPRQKRASATVSAIREATIQLLVGAGLDGLTTTLVAQRAGVSVGTLYQYFPNKRALTHSVLVDHLNTVTDAVVQTCRIHRDIDTDCMARAVVAAYLTAKAGDRDVAHALFGAAIDVDITPAIAEAMDRGEEAIAAMLRTATDASWPDPQATARFVLSALYGTVRAHLERGVDPKPGGTLERQLGTMLTCYLIATRVMFQ